MAVVACGGSSSDSGTIDLVAYSTPQTLYEDSIEPAYQKTDDGSGVDFRCLRFRGCRESLAERAEILELALRQLMVPLAEVPQGLVEPLDLVLGFGTDDTAPHYVLEQLIAGLLERRGLRNLSPTT